MLAHGVEFERTHDLRQLLMTCASIDSEFVSLRKDIQPLSLYAVAFRYPGPGEPKRAEVENALAVVEKVWTFVTKRLPPEVVPGSSAPGPEAP